MVKRRVLILLFTYRCQMQQAQKQKVESMDICAAVYLK